MGMHWRLTIVALALFLSGCAQDVPPIHCEPPDFDCYEQQAVKGITVVRQNIAYLSNLHLLAQIAIAIFGVVATTMIALLGDKNKHWTRPIGLVATALVTGLTSAIVSFHIPENIDKLVDVVEKMVIAANEFGYEVNKLKGGRSKEQIAKAYASDATFQDKVIGVTKQFADNHNRIKIEMLRLSGSAARLNTVARDTSKETYSKK